jgi:type II secretory pathway pseudopilin PulG
MVVGLSNSDFRPASQRMRARGFSFTELLFAVMILGIGFIMIAAIFPVGLSQSKSNFDETQAASVARGAVAVLAQMATDADFPSTGGIVTPVQASPTANRTLMAQSNMINAADQRYAWVALYSRRNDSRSAHVMVIVVNRPDPFDASRVNVGADPFASNASFIRTSNTRSLEPRVVYMQFGADAMSITSIGGTDGRYYNDNAAGPSGFVIIAPTPAQIALTDLTAQNPSNDAAISTDPEDATAAAQQLNGHAYRIGEVRDPATGQFGVFPGYEFQPETFIYKHSTLGYRKITINQPSQKMYAYIVSKNRNTANGFEGPLMDVAYYTSFITVK